MNDLAQIPSVEEIKHIGDRLLDLPQVECSLKHSFAPGLYMREIFMPKGTLVIGNEHRTEHMNIVLSGRARVMTGEGVTEITGPCSFVSKSGVMKILLILEDMRFITLHPTEETNIEKLEEMLFIKTQKRVSYEAELRQLAERTK